MKKFLKIAAALVAVLLILVTAVFLYVNRGGFIKSHIVPRLAEQLKLPVTVEDAEFSYSSVLSLKGIVIGDAQNPVIKAEELTLRYDLWSLITDKDLHVKELKLNNVFAKIDERLIPKKTAKDEVKVENKTAKEDALASSEPALTNYLIENISLENLNISYKLSDGTYAEIESFTLKLKELKPNSPFLLELKSAAQVKQASQQDYKVGHMSLQVKGELDQNFQAKNVNLELLLSYLIGDVHEALSLTGREFQISGDITRENEAFQIKGFRLQELFNKKNASSITIDGFFNPTKQDCNFDISINKVGQSLLAFANGPIAKVPALKQWQDNLKRISNGQISGLGESELAYKGNFAQSNGEIKTKGLLSLKSFPLTKGYDEKLALLKTDLSIDYDLSFNPSQDQLEVKTVKIELKQDKKLVLDLSNSQPLSLTLSKVDGSTMDISGNLEILSLDLSQANSFLPENLMIKNGFLNSRINLAKTAKNVTGNLDISVQSADLSSMNDVIKDLSLSLSSKLDLKDFNELQASNASINLRKKKENILRVFYDASHNLQEEKSTWNVKSLEISPSIKSLILDEIQQSIPIKNLNLKIKALKGELSKAGLKVNGQVISENLELASKKHLTPTSQFSLSLIEDKLNIESFKIWLKSDFHKTVEANLSGQIDLSKKTESKVEITVPTSVDAEAFQKAFTAKTEQTVSTQPKQTPKAPENKPQTKPSSADEKPIHIVTNLRKVSYKLFSVKNININAEIYSDRYILHPSRFTIWGSELETSASFFQKEVPDYSFKLKSKSVKLLPILDQFSPEYSQKIQGEIQIPELSLKGSLGKEPLKSLKGALKLNVEELQLNDFVVDKTKKDKKKKKSFLGGLAGIVTDGMGLGGSELLSKVTGINPNALSFGKSSMDFSLDGGEISSKNIEFKSKKYRFNIAGVYNILNNDGTAHVDAGISGLTNIDKKITSLFRKGDDGLRYLPTVTIPTADFKNKSFFGGLSTMTTKYFLNMGSSFLNSFNPMNRDKKAVPIDNTPENKKKDSKTEKTIKAVEGILNLF